MFDAELERLRKQRLIKLRRRLQPKQEERKEENSKEDAYTLLNKVFVGRAWEVYKATQAQYPQIANKLKDVLAQLASTGKIKKVNGRELYYLLRKMGIRIKLNTKIRIEEHGKLKSIEEKLKE